MIDYKKKYLKYKKKYLAIKKLKGGSRSGMDIDLQAMAHDKVAPYEETPSEEIAATAALDQYSEEGSPTRPKKRRKGNAETPDGNQAWSDQIQGQDQTWPKDAWPGQPGQIPGQVWGAPSDLFGRSAVPENTQSMPAVHPTPWMYKKLGKRGHGPSHNDPSHNNPSHNNPSHNNPSHNNPSHMNHWREEWENNWTKDNKFLDKMVWDRLSKLGDRVPEEVFKVMEKHTHQPLYDPYYLKEVQSLLDRLPDGDIRDEVKQGFEQLSYNFPGKLF